MNILVTGGNGFIGTHLVERLLKEEFNTTVVDHRMSIYAGEFKHKISMFQIGAEDIKCDRVFADTSFDVVVHLAYPSVARDSNVSEIHDLHTDLTGLSNVLHLSQKYHVAKIIVLSSYHIYGLQDSSPVCEDAPIKPVTRIGYHYQTREALCQEYRHIGLNVIVLRVGSVYGPRQESSSDNYIPRLIADRISSHPVMKPDLDPTRIDYIFISDLVEAIFLLTTINAPHVLNISTGTGSTKREIYQCCIKYFLEISTSHDEPEDDRMVLPTEAPGPVIPSSVNSRQQHAGAGIVLDIQLAAESLVWLPRYSLSEGMKKTIEWSIKANEQNQISLANTKTAKKVKFKLNKNAQRAIETLAIFSIAFLLTYLIQYRLNVSLDILLLYVALISLFYGIRQGSIAICLSIAARVWLLSRIEGRQVIDLVNNVSIVMQMTLYLILGVCISYSSDAKSQKNENIAHDLQNIRRELDFVNILYQKSLDVKNSLQSAIENNKNSLSKSLYIISRLERADQDQFYDEVARVFSDAFQAGQVHVYCTEATGHWLRLVSSVGGIQYSKSIQFNQMDFLDMVIREHSIFINRELISGYPLVCVPVFLKEQAIAVIFIDGIEFHSLTQYFINTLKALTALVSESIERKMRYEDKIKDEKYWNGTTILREEWFSKIVKEKIESGNTNALLFKLNTEILNYQDFGRSTTNLIRSIDVVGELSSGHLGIILSDIGLQDVPAIQARFIEKGLSIELIEMEGRAL